MKKLELAVSKQNNVVTIKYALGAADVYDDRVADKITQHSNIIPFQYKDEDGKRSITSYVHEDTNLEVMLKRVLSKKEVLCIMSGLSAIFEIGAQGIPVSYIVKDLNYIYVNADTLAVKCIMVPVKQDVMPLAEIPALFRTIISKMKFNDEDKDNYVAKILTLINSDDFSNSKFKKLVDEQLESMGMFVSKENGLVNFNDNDARNVTVSGVKVNKIGVMNNMQNAMRPQMMPQGQPGPAMPGAAQGQPNPMMSGAPQGQPNPVMPGAPRPMMPQGQPSPAMSGAAQGQSNPMMSGAPRPMMPQGQPGPAMSGVPQGQPNPMMSGAPRSMMPQGQPGPAMPGAAQGQPSPVMPGAAQGQPSQAMSGAPRPMMPQGQPGPAMPGAAQGQPNPAMPVTAQGQPGPAMPGAPRPMMPQGQPGPAMPGAPRPMMPQGQPGPAMPGASQGQPGPVMPGASQGQPGPAMPGASQGQPSPAMPGVPQPSQSVVPQNSEVSQSAGVQSEITQNSETSKLTQPQPINVSEPISEEVAVNDADKTAEDNKTVQDNKPVEDSVATENSKTAEDSKTPEESKNIEKDENNEDNKTSEEKNTPEIVQGSFEVTHGTLVGQLGTKPIPHIVRKKTGEVINITKPEFTIGKSKSKADYAIENNSAISRVHCIIVQKDGVNYIKDNNSTNHTYINGIELQPGKEMLLKNKTVIQLGDEEFTFLLRKGD